MEKIRKALDLARAERAARGADEDGLALVDAPPAAYRAAETGGARVAAGEAAAWLPSTDPVARSPATETVAPRAVTPEFAPDPRLLQRNRVLPQHSTSAAAEAFRMLRTQLLQRMAERDWRVLAVVGPDADEDRAAIAANLAAAIGADRRYHALLVDLDLRAPRIGTLFGLAPKHGVDDVLAGEAAIGECLHRPAGYERLVLLPARSVRPRGSELLSSPATRRLMGELRERYPDRLIVCNLAPMLASDDALAFVPLVDCALMVVSESRTKRAELAEAMSLLSRTPVVGSVLGNAVAAGRSRI